MDQIKYQEFLDSIKPSPENMSIIHSICEDMGITIVEKQPYHILLWKLGKLDMQIMTLSLTTCTGKSWLMGNSIDQVYNQIINNFK